MKTLFILMNHEILPEQRLEAEKNFGITEFVTIGNEEWSQINPSDESVTMSVKYYKILLKQKSKKGDYLLIQGDFGATYHLIRFAKSIGLIAIYATTKRIITEEKIDGKIITKREFKHERFREYED